VMLLWIAKSDLLRKNEKPIVAFVVVQVLGSIYSFLIHGSMATMILLLVK
jgi:hypothetical protein